MTTRRITVSLPQDTKDRSYSIIIDPQEDAKERFAGELKQIAHAGTRIAIVTDETVARLHLGQIEAACARQGLSTSVVIVPDGEPSKSLDRAEAVCESF